MQTESRCPFRQIRLWLVGLALLSLGTGGGCASIRWPELNDPYAVYPIYPSKAHYISAYKDGRPIDPSGLPFDAADLTKEEFQSRFLTPIVDGIDSYVRNARSSRQTARLLVFVHGGLNTYFASLHKVETILKAQEEMTNDQGGKVSPTLRYRHLASYYPVFINWNSSMISSLWDKFVVVRAGLRPRNDGEKFLYYLTAPFVFASKAAESALNSVPAWVSMFDNYDDMVRRSGEEHQDAPWEKTKVGINYFGPLLPVRALSVPVIQSLGTSAWDMMKRRADLLFAINEKDDRQDGKLHYEPGAGALLFEALRKRMCPRDDQDEETCITPNGEAHWALPGEEPVPVEITLVGHSMGAFVLNRLLHRHPDLQFDRIIYLAAASSIVEFETFVQPYLCRANVCRPRTQFWSFSLSSTNEAREYGFLDLYDKGSLLVWIDNYFERVLTPGQRTFGRYLNYEGRYENVLPEKTFRAADCAKRRVSIGRFEGKEGEPRFHGEFSTPQVLETVLRIVDRGECPPLDGPRKGFYGHR